MAIESAEPISGMLLFKFLPREDFPNSAVSLQEEYSRNKLQWFQKEVISMVSKYLYTEWSWSSELYFHSKLKLFVIILKAS